MKKIVSNFTACILCLNLGAVSVNCFADTKPDIYSEDNLAKLRSIDDPVIIMPEEELETKQDKFDTLDSDTKEFISKIKKIQSLMADFKQLEGVKKADSSNSDDNAKIITGKVRLAKPNKLFWEITEPRVEQQVYVTNGAKFWHYDKQLEQVVKDEFDSKRVVNSPLYFLLANVDSLYQDYKVKKLGPNTFSLTDLKPENKESNYVSDLNLKFNLDNDNLQQLSFIAAQNKRIVINLENVKINTGVSNNIFDFKTPQGVDVINAQDLY